MSDTPDESQGRLFGEATPQDVPDADIPAPALGLHDSGWTEAEWRRLLDTLIESGIGSWKDVTALVLGHLNPSQVGTSLASSAGFKRKYGKGNTMRVVMEWVYAQTGRWLTAAPGWNFRPTISKVERVTVTLSTRISLKT